MKYLIPTLNCYVFDEEIVPLRANVQYEIQNVKEQEVIFLENSYPVVIDFNNSKNLVKIHEKNNEYYFFFPQSSNTFFITKFNIQSHEVIISLSDCLNITIDGMLTFQEIVDNLKYSHYEIEKDLCLIYFEGKRNFIVVIKNLEVFVACYYDECNLEDGNKYFLSKLKDSLNHGLVVHIQTNVVEKYLVYLDEEELKLKQDFICFVFLDCVKAGNFKYCNELLNGDLKLKDEKLIKDFFPVFDYFYPLRENKFVLFKKNTLAGICEFVIEDCKVSNITNHH